MTILGRDKVKRDQMMLSTLINQFRRGQINKNHPLQRKADQWTDEAKSGLAATVIKGEDIDSIKICEQIVSSTEFILWLIDGLQRLTVLESYKNNVFAMKKNLEMPIIYYQGVDKDGKVGIIEYDLRGKKYKDLPDELKEKFDSYPVDIVKHLDCTDEEIAYHIGRYNRQTSMNTNQKNVLVSWKIAPYIKKVVTNDFFKDYGNYADIDITKETFNRIVCESVMICFHCDDWKPNKAMYVYLNENSKEEEFLKFNEELDKLSNIIDKDTTGKLFNVKNSFIWFAIYHKFLSYGLKDEKFIDFLNEFQNTLHNVPFKEYEGKTFDNYDKNRGTKDKKTVLSKLDMLTKLMEEYLHINKEETHLESEEIVEDTTETTEEIASETENNTMSSNEEETDSNMSEQNSGSSDILQFVQDNVSKEISELDINDYEQDLEDIVRISSPIYQKCKTALIAIMAYVYRIQKDVEFSEWMENYQNEKTEFSPSQKINYTYIKKDFDNYCAAMA